MWLKNLIEFELLLKYYLQRNSKSDAKLVQKRPICSIFFTTTLFCDTFSCMLFVILSDILINTSAPEDQFVRLLSFATKFNTLSNVYNPLITKAQHNRLQCNQWNAATSVMMNTQPPKAIRCKQRQQIQKSSHTYAAVNGHNRFAPKQLHR